MVESHPDSGARQLLRHRRTNPAHSLADDLATTKRVIYAEKSPVVLVGHSYGGVVNTGASAGAVHFSKIAEKSNLKISPFAKME
ncbi:MAG: hypothetical protein DMF59_14210 [Acidobacteria bacterium]|nr:MAG: hypothetical protein DMF59_14210 [Acidobacteriota bacterium]